MTKLKSSICISFIILLVFFIQNSHAQQVDRYATQRGAQYYLGSEDELLVPVNIWGFVRSPGQYMVPNNTDLVSLLSYAGGPTEEAKISNIRIVRNDMKVGRQAFKINVKRYLETADERIIPILKPGDTIVVKGTTFHWISKFFEFVSRFTVIAQIFYFIAIAQEYLNR